MAIVEFKNISKDYGDGKLAVDDLNLQINEGDFVTLIGPSGCGKTTTLKFINGLIEPSAGEIYVEGKELSKWNKIELRRKIGYVIQQVGLFPHLSIQDNITYVLKIKGIDKTNRKKRAEELIELVGLNKDHLSKYPRELSGGQQQRVGVARALAADPPIILMDEPFGAIDEITRKKLQDELIMIHKKLNKTIVFVTHDIHEAMKLGNRIVLLKEGKLITAGSREDIFFNQENNYLNKFFGIKSFTSYVGVTGVKGAINKVYPVIKINEDKDILKQINYKEIEYIPVIDEKNKYIGVYDMKSQPVFDENNIIPMESINEDKTIMEALEMQFRTGNTMLPVTNNKNKYMGVFKANEAYNSMINKAN
ncbi:betaine/proline/choline family ABC transporter ATP-binding protein [Clostridium sp. D2Q-11]|uniref:Quaternary amine transport ATP-binding protein n=1 Tax=Anaeromonas frigoriresistens TaxID=2683708 RepID=A0A942US72_9FIRM|nr:betaine/proline/choline family ABC transporter ATP-binding protein [Anaeromonas frigoriresistens]